MFNKVWVCMHGLQRGRNAFHIAMEQASPGALDAMEAVAKAARREARLSAMLKATTVTQRTRGAFICHACLILHDDGDMQWCTP